MEIKELFLEAMKAFLEKRTIVCEESVSLEEWNRFFTIAKEQNVIPMVYQSVCRSRAYREAASGIDPVLKRTVYQEVFNQVRKTQEFIELYRALEQKGLTPIVVKGIMLRNLYPEGDSRPSGDEDLYIPQGSYEQYRQTLIDFGMEVVPWNVDKEDILDQVAYCHRGGLLMIEIHKSLFDEEVSSFKGMNDLLEAAHDRSVWVDVNGVKVRTLGHSDHMLFLILHAYKHFITGGFGVRQVCDMAVFANAYGAQIDWQYVYEGCRLIDAEIFAASLFEIGRKHFALDYDKAQYPEMWQKSCVDTQALLDDLLDAGVYGASDMNRKHSSSITVEAVAAYRNGRKAQHSVLSSLFPSRKSLQGRYGYLIRYPFLLPVAWITRMVKYGLNVLGGKQGDSASGALKTGGERVKLLRKYGIIRD